MKKIGKKDILRLATIQPDNCIVISMNEKGIKLIGRLTGYKNKTAFMKYLDREISWGDILKNGLWTIIDRTEWNAIVSEVYIDEKSVTEALSAYNSEDNSEKGIRGYALTEMEFCEVIPVLQAGTYMLFVERQEAIN